MGIVIRCMDAEFTNTIGYVDYPIISQLKNLYYLGGTEAASMIDHSGNGNNGTKLGEFTTETKYCEFSTQAATNAFYAQKPSSGVTKVSGVALMRKNGQRGVVTAINSNGGFGFCTNRILFKGTSWKDHSATGISDDTYFYPVCWKLNETMCGMYRLNDSGSGLITIAEYEDNLSVVFDSANTVTIGGMRGNFSASGTCDLAVAAYYEGDVTNNNFLDALRYIREYGKKIGLDVK